MSKSTSSSSSKTDGNIQVFLRVRPSKNPSGYIEQDQLEENALTFNLPDSFHSDYINNTKLKHVYHFNGLLSMTATQEDVFKKVGMAAVQNALDGYVALSLLKHLFFN
jgi:Ca2+-binding EF-hand superfamily protein